MGECLLTIVSMGYATFPRYGEQSSRTDLVSGLIIRPFLRRLKYRIFLQLGVINIRK